MTRAGVSYFGVRIPRHARRDLEDIAGRGYTAVLHTFSENDLAYYRGTMAEIVAASHELGLEVQMCPWGVGRTFGGEAESRWVTFHPEACQVLDDGRRVATGCLNNPVYRAFCKEWADAAVEAGTDYVFWDEPHWTVPEHVGVDDPERWACCCDVCAELSGLDLAAGLTPEVQAFRERSVVEFLDEMLAHVATRGAKNTICLLPLTDGPHGVSDWDAVASLPHLSVLATDPYWKNFDESAESFVGRFARLLGETAARHGVDAQMWLPSFGLTREEIPELESAIAATRAAGIDDVWTWGYEACGHMTKLATPDAPLVWEAVTKALIGGVRTTERHRVELHDLDLRPTAELVRLINDEDHTVASAVAGGADAIGAVIDAIVERLEAGGRLVYVGAGSSGRAAEADAAECGPTFSTDQILAVTSTEEAAEDDGAAAVGELERLNVGPPDVVLGISASGRTPYTLAAVDHASKRRCAHDRARLRPGFGAGAPTRTVDRDRCRPRGDRRVHAAEGGHRSEAGAERDLDDRDGEAGQDLRESHGRRAGLEREAARAGRAGGRDRDSCSGQGGRRGDRCCRRRHESCNRVAACGCRCPDRTVPVDRRARRRPRGGVRCRGLKRSCGSSRQRSSASSMRRR